MMGGNNSIEVDLISYGFDVDLSAASGDTGYVIKSRIVEDNVKLVGSGFNDTLAGWTGDDTLIGGAGADLFVFDVPLWNSPTGDLLADFAVGEDKIELVTALEFSAFADGKTVLADNLVVASGAQAQDANDFLIFDTETGNLYYDADGNGAGTATLFAHFPLQAGTTLSAQDFVVI
jgi:serralysin